MQPFHSDARACRHEQYTASLEDGVIGVVTDRNADAYRVNIGAAYASAAAPLLLLLLLLLLT
jgi:exosome complex RNA-binding protein Rrp4